MTRPKRDGEKGDRANKAELLISVDEFMKTRDNVVTSLTTLQGAIGDLLRAYLSHTTAVLGGTGNISAELNAVTANILTNARPGASEDQILTALPTLPSFAGDIKIAKKKKQQRRKKDPNAPKAPPTAYFLYAQSARAGIREDLGDVVKGNAVTEEASKRWNGMSEEEKQRWKDTYQKNFADYKVRLAAYNAEKAARGEDTIEAEAEDENLDTAASADVLQASAAAQAEEEQEESSSSSSSSSEESSESEESEEEAAPPPKPEPLAKKRSKRTNGEVAAAPAAPVAAAKSPEKKRKGENVKESSPEEPKKKKSKKGKAAEPEPEPELEPEPEAPTTTKEKKRKRKNEGKA